MSHKKLISCKAIISKVYRDLQLQEESRWHDMIEWIGEALGFIDSTPQYVDKMQTIHVKDHRGVLPCDLYVITQTLYQRLPMRYATDTRISHYHELKSADLIVPYNGDTPTYTINGNYINTSIRNGEIHMMYKAFPTDEDGFPMVSDEISVRTALFFYILKQMILGGYVHPTFTYDKAYAEWDWYCGQARGKMNMPNLDEQEMICRTLTRLIPQIHVYQGMFANQSTDDRMIQ